MAHCIRERLGTDSPRCRVVTADSGKIVEADGRFAEASPGRRRARLRSPVPDHALPLRERSDERVR